MHSEAFTWNITPSNYNVYLIPGSLLLKTLFTVSVFQCLMQAVGTARNSISVMDFGLARACCAQN